MTLIRPRLNRAMVWLCAFILAVIGCIVGSCIASGQDKGTVPSRGAPRSPIEISADYSRARELDTAWWQLLPGETENTLPKGSNCDELAAWLRARGGVDRGSSRVTLWVRAMTTVKIRIVRARSRLVRHGAPPAGNSLLCIPDEESGMDPEGTLEDGFVVDRDGYRSVVPSERVFGGPSADPQDFDIELGIGEVEELEFGGYAHGCDCSWLIELELEINGGSWRYTVGRGSAAEPFRTISAPSAPGDARTTRVWCAIDGKGFLTSPDPKKCPVPYVYETPLY
jgi:hypothetical protein